METNLSFYHCIGNVDAYMAVQVAHEKFWKLWQAYPLVWDNLATILSSDRGRATAYCLIARIRHASCFLLPAGIMPYDRWLASERNPADGFSGRSPEDAHAFHVQQSQCDNDERRYQAAVRTESFRLKSLSGNGTGAAGCQWSDPWGNTPAATTTPKHLHRTREGGVAGGAVFRRLTPLMAISSTVTTPVCKPMCRPECKRKEISGPQATVTNIWEAGSMQVVASEVIGGGAKRRATNADRKEMRMMLALSKHQVLLVQIQKLSPLFTELQIHRVQE